MQDQTTLRNTSTTDENDDGNDSPWVREISSGGSKSRSVAPSDGIASLSLISRSSYKSERNLERVMCLWVTWWFFRVLEAVLVPVFKLSFDTTPAAPSLVHLRSNGRQRATSQCRRDRISKQAQNRGFTCSGSDSAAHRWSLTYTRLAGRDLGGLAGMFPLVASEFRRRAELPMALSFNFHNRDGAPFKRHL